MKSPANDVAHASRSGQATINSAVFCVTDAKSPRRTRRRQEHTKKKMMMMKKKKSSRLGVVLPLVAFLVLAAAHLARAAREREPRDLAFVAAAHGALALLFLCLGRHDDEVAAPTAEARGRLKVGVWALSTALTGMFACRVAQAMPPPLALLFYGVAVLVTAGGFVLLFLCNAGGRR